VAEALGRAAEALAKTPKIDLSAPLCSSSIKLSLIEAGGGEGNKGGGGERAGRRMPRGSHGRWSEGLPKIGDRLKGKYKGSQWFDCVVVGREGERYVIEWDDGDLQDTLKELQHLKKRPA